MTIRVPEREQTAAARVGLVDAVVGFALLVAGSEGLTRSTVTYARQHDLPWLPAYAGHAWLLLVPLFWLLVLNRRFPLGRLDGRMARVWLWPWVIGAGVALIAGLALIASGQPVAVGDVVQPSALTILMLLLYQGIFVAVSEELAYRGLVQTGLNRAIGSGLRFGRLQIGYGTILAATLFGAVHVTALDRQSLVVTEAEVIIGFVGGLVAGYFYERTDSIWGAIVFHGLYNLLFAIPLLLTLR